MIQWKIWPTLCKNFREDKIGYKNLLVRQNSIQLEVRSPEKLKTVKENN